MAGTRDIPARGARDAGEYQAVWTALKMFLSVVALLVLGFVLLLWVSGGSTVIRVVNLGSKPIRGLEVEGRDGRHRFDLEAGQAAEAEVGLPRGDSLLSLWAVRDGRECPIGSFGYQDLPWGSGLFEVSLNDSGSGVVLVRRAAGPRSELHLDRSAGTDDDTCARRVFAP